MDAYIRQSLFGRIGPQDAFYRRKASLLTMSVSPFATCALSLFSQFFFADKLTQVTATVLRIFVVPAGRAEVMQCLICTLICQCAPCAAAVYIDGVCKRVSVFHSLTVTAGIAIPDFAVRHAPCRRAMHYELSSVHSADYLQCAFVPCTIITFEDQYQTFNIAVTRPATEFREEEKITVNSINTVRYR